VTLPPQATHSNVCISEPSSRNQSGSMRAIVIRRRHCLQIGRFNAFVAGNRCGLTGLSLASQGRFGAAILGLSVCYPTQFLEYYQRRCVSCALKK
jgi:hypothetical protein